MSSAEDRMFLLPNVDLPVHERLAEAIERAILGGRFSAGERLPTHREIARTSNVAIGTVTRAIDALSRKGIVRGEVGRGTFVQPIAPDAPRGGVIDLAINAPPPLIPADILATAAERSARRAAELPYGGYVDVTGVPDQRAIMAGWLTRTRLPAGPDELILCVGAQHGIHLAFADLRPLSSSIATEGATFTGAIAAANDLGMDLFSVAHDEDGMLPEDLDRVLTKTGCRVVYTTPVCQNPMGFETGPERRSEILAVCRARGAMIVEDDIYGVFAAKGPATYKALAPDFVYFVTSLSKCMAPFLRTGVLVPPAERRPDIARRLRAEIWGASPLGIGTACALIELGADVVAAKTLRVEARERLGDAVQILGLRSLPMPDGAAHIWIPMPLPEAERFARRAAERGVKLTPPDATLSGDLDVTGIRLCTMAPPVRSDLRRALEILSELVGSPSRAVV